MNRTTAKLADRTAKLINRRAFIRKSASAAFATVAGLVVGFPQLALAYPSHCAGSGSQGAGCPGSSHGYPCGPSECCNSSSRSSNCKCSNGTTCKNTANCLGKDENTWGSGVNCWTCTGPWKPFGPSCERRYITTCCDCETTGCGDSSGHCIGYYASAQFQGSQCPEAPSG